MRKSKNRKRVKAKQQPRTPTAKARRKIRTAPRPFYAGNDALDYRLPGSFESNQ